LFFLCSTTLGTYGFFAAGGCGIGFGFEISGAYSARIHR
jgi:hypothetical protein